MDLREIQGLMDTAPEERREDSLMRISAPRPEPDVKGGDAVQDNKLTLDNRAEASGFLFFPAFWLLLQHGPFYDTGAETKAKRGRRMGMYSNIFREIKKQKKKL